VEQSGVGVLEMSWQTYGEEVMSKAIFGRAFFQSLPKELRDKLPSRARRIVIDVPCDGAVRLLCETLVDEDIARPLVEQVLSADIDVEVVEVPVPASDDPYDNTFNKGNVDE
jgi:hypothetical protein